MNIGQRKSDHLTLCSTDEVRFRSATTLFEDVRLVHDALAGELALDAIDTTVTLFEKKLRAPIFIASMTGGTDAAMRVNRELSSIAEERGYAFGLGSQRAMHVRGDEATAATYRVRESAPSALILGNIGVVQARKMTTDEVLALVRAAGADALFVHLNPAMEIVQPGGDRDFGGALDTIARLVRELPVPVVAKETGCGLSPGVARRLAGAGVKHVDVSGAGGTSWVGVETKRAEEQGDARARALGEAFWDWGVPTAASVASIAALGCMDTIVATGGVASGVDVAKAIALGATCAGIARPALMALTAGGRAGAVAFFERVEAELRAAMLLTGCRDVASLRRAPRVIGGELRLWLEQMRA